jgi:hypothetical protein
MLHQAMTKDLPQPEWFLQRLFHEFSDNNETISLQGNKNKLFDIKYKYYEYKLIIKRFGKYN